MMRERVLTLEWLLRKLDIERLWIAGIVTNGGVSSTVRDAHLRDFAVKVVSDGCAAFTPSTHALSMAELDSLVGSRDCAGLLSDLAAA